MGTDRDWEQWGASDPYFGVLSRKQFRANGMSQAARDEFFATGQKHVARILASIEDNFGANVAPGNVLDFGCGVGRLTIPFAQIAAHATGVDISPSMLAEAKKNCALQDVANIAFVQSCDDDLSNLDGQFDLINSDIVLPHIPWVRGRRIIHALAKHVAPGGYLALQLLTRCDSNAAIRALVRLRYVFPPANWLRNLMRLRPMFEPAMQLHVYDLGKIQDDLTQLGFTVKHSDNAIRGFTSTTVFALRTPSQAREPRDAVEPAHVPRAGAQHV